VFHQVIFLSYRRHGPYSRKNLIRLKHPVSDLQKFLPATAGTLQPWCSGSACEPCGCCKVPSRIRPSPPPPISTNFYRKPTPPEKWYSEICANRTTGALPTLMLSRRCYASKPWNCYKCRPGVQSSLRTLANNKATVTLRVGRRKDNVAFGWHDEWNTILVNIAR
jgi:hypothetical protein